MGFILFFMAMFSFLHAFWMTTVVLNVPPVDFHLFFREAVTQSVVLAFFTIIGAIVLYKTITPGY